MSLRADAVVQPSLLNISSSTFITTTTNYDQNKKEAFKNTEQLETRRKTYEQCD